MQVAKGSDMQGVRVLVDLSQRMKRINQVLLVGRGGDAVLRLAWVAGDLVLPSGHGCLNTGGK